MSLTENDFMALTALVMTDQNYQNVNVKTVDLWLLLNACQMMVIQEGISDALRYMYRDLGQRLQAIVVTVHPETEPLAQAGWNTFVVLDAGHPFYKMYFPDDDDDDDPPEEDYPV